MSSSNKLFPAVDDAAFGKSSYKHSENYIERLARVRISFSYIIFYVVVSTIELIFNFNFKSHSI